MTKRAYFRKSSNPFMRLWLLPLFLSLLVVAEEPCVKATDPDDFFDRLGAQCTDYSDGSPSALSRGDLGSGKLSFSIGTGEDIIRSLAAQTDGKLVATGKSAIGNKLAFAIVRFAVDGSFDEGFNTTGQVVVTFGTTDSLGHRVVIQSDGKSFYAGRSVISGGYDYLAARYLENGTLDTSFGTLGYVQIAVGTGTDIARGLTLDGLGRYYLSGYSWVADSSYYVSSAMRLNTNGTLDTAFATSGSKIFDFVNSSSGILATELDTLGNVLFGGTAYSTDWQMLVGRLSSNGSLDTSFQTTGWVLLSLGTGNDQLYSLRTYQDKTVIAGASYNGTNMDAAVLRLNSDGSYDTAFATSGKRSTSFSTGDDYLYDLRIDIKGGFAVSGYGTQSNQDFLTARYTSNGSLDTAFLTVGFALTTISNTNDQANAIYLTSSGQIYPSGRIILSGSDSDMALARFSPSGIVAFSGSLDESFATAGTFYNNIDAGSDYERAQGIAFSADGKITIIGGDSNRTYTYWARLLPNGSFDTAFNTSGKYLPSNPFGSMTNCWAEIQADGNPVGGCMTSGGSPYLFRLTSNGNYDTSFQTVGYISIAALRQTAHGILDTSGRILNVGLNGGTWRIALARVNSDGTLDATFGTSGVAQDIGSGHAPYVISLDGAGRVLAVGWDGGSMATVARYNTNGTLDTTFFTAGWRDFTFGNSAKAQGVGATSDGKIYVAATLSTVAGYVNFTYRLTSNGILDTAFNTVGHASIALGGTAGTNGSFLMVQSNNKVIVDLQICGNAAYARYNTNGTLDTSFATAGQLIKPITGFTGYRFRLSNDGRICATGTYSMYGGQSGGFTATCFWP